MSLFKGFLVGLLFSVSQISLAENNPDIILTSDIIRIIDGFPHPWGIDANVIKMMLQVRRELKRLQYGIPDKQGICQGHYTFEQNYHSVRTLTLLENKYETEYYLTLDLYTKNKRTNDVKELNQWYTTIKNDLKKCLEQAQAEFDEKVASFTKNARGGKEQMLILIAEFCKKRNRVDCFLLKWADAPEGNETKLMHEQIVTFKVFDQFCTDLIEFLEALMHSCPKAWGQFKKIMDLQAPAIK